MPDTSSRPSSSPARPRLLCVGNGLVANRAIRELLSRAPGQFDISVFGEEAHDCYDRIRLSGVLSGDVSLAALTVADARWYDERGVTLHKGVRVVSIDRAHRTITDDRGNTHPYDHLLLCTGSRARTLDVPGADLPGVLTFRDLDDVRRLVDASQSGIRKAVVVGGGLLGIEAAAGLRRRGMEVTILHLREHLMERELDATAGGLLQAFLEESGITVRLGVETQAILGESRVRGVALGDGEEVLADLVVTAIGIAPRAELARQAGLLCKDGIIINDRLRTSDPAISALGECIEHRGRTFGVVAPLYEMARIWANEVCEPYSISYAGSESSARLKVGGVNVFSAGRIDASAETEIITFHDARRRIYKKLLLAGSHLRGAILYGDVTDGAWYARLIRERVDVSSFRDDLVFGQSYAENTRKESPAAIVPLADDSEVCGCNGVCKRDIVRAIWTHGLTSVQAIRRQTKASASCGSCTKLVEQILVETRGKDTTAGPAQESICPCTDLTHDDVRREILERGIRSVAGIMSALGWKRPDGCHACRPALNYYLLCAWPGEYEDEQSSRFVNERLHANIQRDGSYSVVPRMWGGVTTPTELRTIADVAEKFSIPTIKITGGQRIDLLGVRKEDLPAVWADLGRAGFVSGHAYGKAVRTVKTCVGTEWCRFGTQDSTTMGIEIERACWGAWTPHKVKMAVSGCPRNCAEATVKDLGVVAVESGWEIHVGGNGGTRVRVADLLCKVETPAEVLEYSRAFMQLYRESARYLERTSRWVERVGLDFVRSKLVEDPAERQSLAQRFLESQKTAQVDPWAHISGRGELPESLPIVE